MDPELGMLIQEATQTAQAHAIAMRRLLKKYKELQEVKAPEKVTAIYCPPPRVKPPPPVTRGSYLEEAFDTEGIPTDDEIRESLHKSGII